jgi:LytS/YehU family sensor histidine kinase
MYCAPLDVGERHLVPLQTELRIVRGYAADERTLCRPGQHQRDIDDAALACEVPVMSVQPLLENVFKHTVERRRQPGLHPCLGPAPAGILLLRVQDDSGTLTTACAEDGNGR